jgi:hypothetical protein
MTAAVIGAGAAVLAPSAAQADGNVGAFLRHLNTLRSAHGLAPLTLASDLSSIAQQHSASMAAQGRIFHNPSLTSQVQNWQTVGENVGMGPTEVLIDNAFDHSPAHYANEVNTSYTQVGIGSVTRADGQIFVTLDFRRPMNAGQATATPKAPKTTAPKTTTPRTTKSATPQAPTGQVTAAANAAATQQAATAQARATARAAAAAQNAGLTATLKTGTDPLARALVFSAQVNTLGQTG